VEIYDGPKLRLYRNPTDMGHAQVGARPSMRKAITSLKISGPLQFWYQSP